MIEWSGTPTFVLFATKPELMFCPPPRLENAPSKSFSEAQMVDYAAALTMKEAAN
jgi:hypothetical protein